MAASILCDVVYIYNGMSLSVNQQGLRQEKLFTQDAWTHRCGASATNPSIRGNPPLQWHDTPFRWMVYTCGQ